MLDRQVKYLIIRKWKYKLSLSFSNTCLHTWTDYDFDKINRNIIIMVNIIIKSYMYIKHLNKL